MRLFVAIELAEAWRRAARLARAELEVRLSNEARMALRWVGPELLHLTLRFLGDFPDDTVEQLQRALTREIGALDLALTSAGAGGFGGRTGIRVVWLGVGGDIDGLAALRQCVERACVASGARPETRTLSPHVTLARVRERTTANARREIAAAVESLVPPAPVLLRVNGIALVRSNLRGGAPRYEVLSRHPPGH